MTQQMVEDFSEIDLFQALMEALQLHYLQQLPLEVVYQTIVLLLQDLKELEVMLMLMTMQHIMVQQWEVSYVFSARVITGFTRPKKYISEVTVYTEPILIGSLQKEDPKELQIIADMITASGIKCELTDEIDKYLWAKMLYNCTLNPLGAVLDVNYGKLTENEYTLEIMNNLIDEIFNVIKASSYSTLWNNSDEYKDIFYSKLVPDTYNHYSSTHQDIQRKIKTEIDSLTGKVIQLGEKNNIDVSTNKIIYNLIKAIESEF